MENAIVDPQTGMPRVINLLPNYSRGVGVRVEVDGFLEGHVFMSRDYTPDEIERLTLADACGVYASLQRSDGPANLPEGLRPLMTIRVYASDAGVSSMIRAVSVLMADSE